MPTYTVTSVEGTLDAPRRAKIAAAITRIHSETTGAPTYFAQVIFTEVAPDCYFVGGSPLKGQQVFVNGQIRVGEQERLGLHHRSRAAADGRVRSCASGSWRRGTMGCGAAGSRQGTHAEFRSPPLSRARPRRPRLHRNYTIDYVTRA